MRKYPSDPEEARARVIEIVKLLRTDAERLVALHEFFEAGKTHAEALAPFEEGTVVMLLRGALLEAMIIACTRAWDTAQPARYSIPTAQHLLADPATFGAVAAAGECSALSHFLRLADETKETYSNDRLREFQNYKLAHHLPELWGNVEAAKVGHLLDAIDDITRTIHQLCIGTGITSVTLNSVASVWSKRCQEYWRRLMEGSPGRQIVK